jgi:glycosyltransferase involved in cell wall biosynthesis
MPRISIVSAGLNQASTVRETIESVLTQDHDDLEYWLIDGGSTDGTLDIVREYDKDPRFHWLSEPDQGQSDAINKGLARCAGTIFNWINTDDYLEPGALRAVAEAFERNPHADIVSGYTDEFRQGDPAYHNRTKLQLRASREESMTVGVYCQPSTFWRIEVFRSLGGVNRSLRCMMDWDLWMRYLGRYGQKNVVLLDRLLAHYRHHAAAKTSRLSDEFYREAARIFQGLHLSLQAPPDFLIEERGAGKVELPPFRVDESFDRELYFGKYAERMVRIHRRTNPPLAKTWLQRAFRFKPWVSFWRLKMWFRLLGEKRAPGNAPAVQQG